MKILVTGGAGFIGSHFIRHVLKQHLDIEIVNLDRLTYAGDLRRLGDVAADPRYQFVHGDIADAELVERLLRGGIDVIINFAAESHVDRSILNSRAFLETNVLGVQVLLEASRRWGVERFLQIGTDEVYGSLEEGRFTEESPLAPNSPYAASKAAADLLCRAYEKTYGLPVIITRSSNNYGPWQFPEKLIPLFITNALEGRPLPLYGDGLYLREWLSVEDHCEALDLVLHQGRPGEIYNIGGTDGWPNLEIAKLILRELGLPKSLLIHVQDRPGHDRRYALDSTKIQQELGWMPRRPFEEGLKETIRWYQANQDWWRAVKAGEAFQEYYQRRYGESAR